MTPSVDANPRPSLTPSVNSFTRTHRRDTDELGNPEMAQRAVRFPSSNLTSDSFVRIDSWHHEREDETSEESAGSWCCRWRTWSRKQQLILASCVIGLLFIISTIIILLIIFVFAGIGNNHGNIHNNVYSSTTPEPSTLPSTTPSPYLTGYVIQTTSTYYPLGINITSLTPSYRHFVFQDSLIAYSISDSTLLLFNFTSKDFSSPKNLTIDTMGCNYCDVVSVADVNDTVSEVDLIYYCSQCSSGATRFMVKGVVFEVSDTVIETQVSTDGNTLFITTYSNPTVSCTFQSFSVNSSSMSTKAGPPITCNALGNSSDVVNGSYVQSSITLNFEDNQSSSWIQNQVFSVIDSQGDQYINYMVNSFEKVISYGMDNSTKILRSSVVSKNSEKLILFATVTVNGFYVTRLSYPSGSISILAGGQQKFAFDGQFKDAFWAGDQLILWFYEREGVNIVTYKFQWPSDSSNSDTSNNSTPQLEYSSKSIKPTTGTSI